MSAHPRHGDPLRALARPGGLAALAVTAIAALVSIQAADGPWLAELGRTIARNGGIPDGVPYASAASRGWPNVPVLGELAFALFSTLGGRGLQIAQVAAVAGTLALLLRDARRGGAQERGIAIALLLLLPACFGPIVAIRGQLFSLPLFAACALLLRAETREPSRRIWLLVPLLALWGNLHGAVLTGAAVAGAYLVFERGRKRPGESLAVMLASVLALFVNPALWETPCLRARRPAQPGCAPGHRRSGRRSARATGWTSPSCSPAAVLLAGAVRSRPRAWEFVALGGLALLTLHASRGGVWLALFAVPLAASGFGGRVRSEPLPRLAKPLALALLVAVLLGLAHGPLPSGATPPTIDRTLAIAHGTPVLAEDLLAEQVADAGGRVWVSNPIDAFSTADQRVYVHWLRGLPSGDAALAHAPRAVLVRNGRQGGSPAAPRWRVPQGHVRPARRALRARPPVLSRGLRLRRARPRPRRSSRSGRTARAGGASADDDCQPAARTSSARACRNARRASAR